MKEKKASLAVQIWIRDTGYDCLLIFQSWHWVMSGEGMGIDNDYACGYSCACGYGCQRRNKGREGKEH